MSNRTRAAMVFGFLAVFAAFSPAPALEDYRLEILPTLIVGQSYDDNVFLTRDNRQSDYITTVSPGVLVHLDSARTRLDLEYFPTFVWYNDLSENDTVRHHARLGLVHRFTKFLYLDLRESYTRTEDPYVEILDPVLRSQGVRNTRNPYSRTEGSAALHYQFARRDTASVGFDHTLLENDDPSIDDIAFYGPTASLTHWFDVRNGLELNYRYNVYEYDRESGPATREDLTAHVAGVRYLHQFNPLTRVYVGYTVTTRDFDGQREDYLVHEARAGVDYRFERDWKLTLEAGAFDPTSSANSDGGLLFNARVEKQMKRGRFTLGLDTGWDEGLLESRSRGFTQYWGLTASGEYRFAEKLIGTIRASYRENDEKRDAFGDFSTIYCIAALRYEIRKRIFMGVEYSYLEQDGDNDLLDFRNNRILFTVSGSYSFLSTDRPGQRRPMETTVR